jgi:hypothetical protein
MPRQYEPPREWDAPKRELPSEQFLGESSTTPIHEAVGRALSSWEHAESAFIKLFQLLCETRSLAAPRAYGTLDSTFARQLALKYAAEEFFAQRDAEDLSLVQSLLKIYSKAAEHRNQIAHGMAMQPHAFGYFLCPPSYSSRRRETPYPTQQWGFGAKYFYRVSEIDSIRDHFEQILGSCMSMVLFLNEKYSVLPPGEFHP